MQGKYNTDIAKAKEVGSRVPDPVVSRKFKRMQEKDNRKLSGLVAKYFGYKKKEPKDIGGIAHFYKQLNKAWKYYASKHNRAKKGYELNLDAFEVGVNYYETHLQKK